MTGVKFRPVSLGGETQYYNVLFLKEQLDKVKSYANLHDLTRAEVVRRAVEEFLENIGGKG